MSIAPRFAPQSPWHVRHNAGIRAPQLPRKAAWRTTRNAATTGLSNTSSKANAKRKTLWLGKVAAETADDAIELLETLLEIRSGDLPESDAAAALVRVRRSVDGRGEEIKQRLHDAGLIPNDMQSPAQRKQQRRKLADVIEEYVNSRNDVKPSTKEVWAGVIDCILDFFGECHTDEINVGKAKAYLTHLRGKAAGRDRDGNLKTMAS